MNILPFIAGCGITLALAYVIYGRLISRWFGLDSSRVTPAVEHDDGIDFVPAPAPVVLGGHFTAIAAAGPIVGPILAGQMFGWVPAMLWIVIGAIFIGGVHDAGSLIASLRHNATSITQVVRQHMSRTAYLTFLLFVWFCLIYVIIAFADVTAGSFAKFSEVTFHVSGHVERVNGGAVAVGAAAYLLCSVALGLALRFTRLPWWMALPLFVAALGLAIYGADPTARWLAGHGVGFMNTEAIKGDAATVGMWIKRWDMVLLAYCFIASIVPMWLLLQPRGLIGATFLYAALFFGAVGAILGGMGGDASLKVQWPAFTGFSAGDGSVLFPFLFITIACGACSGFHSVVSSGTTCKQIRNERDVKPVAYGAMLLEAMVALFALSCVMVMAKGAGIGSPDAIYARGMANFMSVGFNIPMAFGLGFGFLAFSSFVFDTLDVCTRLGRYVFQELTGLSGLWGGAMATIATLALPGLYLWAMPAGSFKDFWLLFGTSNQLLAALTLVGVSVWLWRTGRPVLFALLPAGFMVASTGTALYFNFRHFLRLYLGLKPEDVATRAVPYLINMGIAVVLFALAGLVVGEAIRVLRRSRRESLGFAVVSRQRVS